MKINTPQPEEFLGPEGILVTHPHIFAPDDQLVNVLGGMGIGEYVGTGRLKIERAKAMARIEGKTILPEKVVRR
ncbi:hypothetical protein HZC32_01650 [Candidatus Woesearchaeota archaeon]|nr:hypothetical protein [Candidatus Woesearchaeota archaeon]